MSGIMKGRIGFITGAANGIGRATAIGMAEEGAAAVVVSDLENERAAAEEVVREIEKLGAKSAFIPCDVVKEDEVINLVNETVKRFGGLDFAVNNVGVGRPAKLADQTYEDAKWTIDVDVLGTFLCLKYELLYMREHGGGSIVNISSSAGLVGQDNNGMYCAGKHAVLGMTKTAASENARLNIRVNAMCPGKTRTRATAPFISRDPGWLASTAMGRMAEPYEMANAVVFLASDKASYITGVSLSVDGGSNCTTSSYRDLLKELEK